MSATSYVTYLDAAIAGYAEDNVASRRWPAEGAFARSQADFATSLPKGLETPDNYLFEIWTGKTGAMVGFIWFAVVEKNGLKSAFVYDVEIKPEFRRQGHAAAAFEALEPLVQKLGLTSIGLHVFSQNAGAQALYRKLGYSVMSVNMLKHLGTPPA
jgi:ribosomal protein S18 acetylase RimI-like enzyme